MSSARPLFATSSEPLWMAAISNRRILMDATKADDYRMRSEILRKKTKKRQSSVDHGRLVRKAKALNDLADNEDWLNGKPTSKRK